MVSVELGGLDESHDHGGSLTCAQGAGEQPIRSAQSHRADSVFDVIVVDRQIAVRSLPTRAVQSLLPGRKSTTGLVCTISEYHRRIYRLT